MIERETIAEIVAVFNIQSEADIKNISADTLLNLYNRGKAELVCTVGTTDCYSLYFRKEKNKLTARNDRDTVHELLSLLETTEQFIEYTERYYRLQQGKDFELAAKQNN